MTNQKPIKILKASAGSGKTFNLVRYYLDLCFNNSRENPFYFRHILAITFTNKATNEMRERILDEVRTLAEKPEKSDHIRYLTEKSGKSEAGIQAFAQMMLKNMIQHYEQISVSTIDSFFQRVLRAFAREMGMDTAFRVQLNQDEVIGKAVNKLVRDIDEGHNLYSWMDLELDRKVAEGKKFNLKEILEELAEQLYKESIDFEKLNEINPESLQKLYKKLIAREEELKKQNLEFIEKAKQSMVDYGFVIGDFAYGNSSFMSALTTKVELNKLEDVLTSKRIADVREDANAMYTKSNASRADEYITYYNSFLQQHIEDYIAFAKAAYNEYNSNNAILEELASFTTLRVLIPYLTEVKRENNWTLLSETNRLLSDLIEELYVPFLYEKIAGQYHHLLIDEFQDTSEFQWRNLRPLVEENSSSNYRNLIVGDIKQAIYRFRNGNWDLLRQQVEADFPGLTYVDNLGENYRSDEKVIAFNNHIFHPEQFPKLMRESIEWVWNDKHVLKREDENTPETNIREIYADSHQNVPEFKLGKIGGKGYVEINFLEKDKIDKKSGEIIHDNSELYRQKLHNIFLNIQNTGYKPGDIAILCRRKKHITKIVEAIEEIKADSQSFPGIKPEFLHYVNNEALLLDNDPCVRFILANFRMMTEPEVKKEGKAPKKDVHPYEVVYLAEDSFNFKASKEEMEQKAQKWRDKHAEIEGASLVEIAEILLNELPEEKLDKHAIYIHSFLEHLLQYQSENGSHIGEFLDYWAEENIMLSLPDNISAIQLMTVHKSKGLAFPIVIMPYLDWSFRHESIFKNILWTDYTFEGENLRLPLDWSHSGLDSDFTEEIFEETVNTHIDMLNLFYVGMTRSKHEIYTISEVPSDDNKASRDNINYQLTQFVSGNKDFLNAHEDLPEGIHTYSYGIQEGRVKEDKDKTGTSILKATRYRSELPGLRTLAWEEDTLAPESEKKEQVLRGNAIHKILENVEYIDDLERATRTAVLDGTIPVGEQDKWINHLRKLIDIPEVNALFSRDYKVLRERRITVKGGRTLIPDRVIMNEDGVHIIDYKTGENKDPKYARQVEKYKELYEEMGYKNVKASLLYTQLKELERIA